MVSRCNLRLIVSDNEITVIQYISTVIYKPVQSTPKYTIISYGKPSAVTHKKDKANPIFALFALAPLRFGDSIFYHNHYRLGKCPGFSTHTAPV